MCFACNVKAQDKLITQTGDVKIVYNVEVGTNKVFYTLENKKDAPIQQIAKQDVLTIIHPDGSKEILNKDNVSNQKDEIQQENNSLPSFSKKERHPIVTKNGEYNPVLFANDKKKGKRCYSCYVVYQFKNGSVKEDDNISAEYKVIGYDDKASGLSNHFDLEPTDDMRDIHYTYGLEVKLKNKTSRTIYIDLGNTFITRGTEAAPYYTPTATSSTNGKNGGVGVNVGSVTGALGIGGIVGGIANGVNVGGGSSSSETTTTYSQRVVAIPPLSQKTLMDQFLFPIGSETLYNNNISNFILDKKTSAIETSLAFEHIERGQSMLFDENDSPIKFSSYITYSFNENCTETSNLQANMYIKQVIGISESKDLSSDWAERPYFIIRK